MSFADTTPLLWVDGLKMHFSGRRRQWYPWSPRSQIKAVDGVQFGIASGRTLGLVGESGCGKSTIARAVLKLYKPTSGSILFDGVDITEKNRAELREFRERAQIIFQDPYASLDPRRSIGYTIGEPLMLHSTLSKAEIQKKVETLLRTVGLNPSYINRYPHEFSGGQRQRVGVARALATSPSFLVADEPVSALDISIQAQVINLLKRLREELSLTFLFISHDLRVVRYISDEVAVMYLGKLVEQAPTDDFFADPRHPYSQALLSAVPKAPWEDTGVQPITLEGEVPSPIDPPPGCHFAPRCRFAGRRCRIEEPEFKDTTPGHKVACFLMDGTTD